MRASHAILCPVQSAQYKNIIEEKKNLSENLFETKLS